MEKKDYFNSVTAQVRELETLAGIQAGLCFDPEQWKGVLDPDAAGKIRRVIITGCGDSYSAAGAMLPGFKKLSGLADCASPDIMDFCRYYSPLKIRKEYAPEEVLVAGISFSGGSERVVEALEKANGLGAESLLITRNPDSRAGRAAKHVLNVATPEGCNTPGLRSYYASLVGIAALGAYLGLCGGRLSMDRFRSVGESIAAYTAEFMKDFERIDDLMFSEALRMKDLTKFEVIADWNEGYSAQFVEQKFIECGGVFCGHTNSEEFAHISFFARGPEEFGTVVMINGADPSLSRMKDTINGCLAQHRPTLIVTDAAPETFAITRRDDAKDRQAFKMFRFAEADFDSMALADKPTVCRIAKAPEQWMSPLVDFVPGALLAGYQAAVNEKKYFGGRYDFRTQTWDRK